MKWLTNENKKGPPVPPPPPEPVLTAIEKELKGAGPKRPDGSDTFIGFANVSFSFLDTSNAAY